VPQFHVFLAGATGVLGRRVIPLLVARGHRVTAMTRQPSQVPALRELGAEAVVVDVYDAAGLTAAVVAAAPDVVMHQLTDLGSMDFAANTEIRRTGTRNLVDAAVAAGVRRIVAQGISWAYEPGDGPATEATPLDLGADEPRRATVLGVAALEETVRELPEWVVLRYGLFYGPGTWYSRGGLMATRPLVANGDVTGFVHVDDAAHAAVEALSWPTGAVNVCDDEPAPASEWVPAFCRSVGVPPPPVTEGRAGWARGADSHHARARLGWTPRFSTWREGFARG
jgi:nucleoside-diphosphate-sugar epimerase